MGTQGHSVVPSGKRVQVVLHNNASFVAKFKGKEGGFHHFHDHDKVKSNKVNALRILPTGVEPISERERLKREEIKASIKKIYPNAKVKIVNAARRADDPVSDLVVKSRKPTLTHTKSAQSDPKRKANT